MTKKDTIDTSNIAVMKFDKNISVKDKINQLKANPNIEYAEPNYIYKVQLFSDPDVLHLRALPKIKRNEAISLTGSTNTTGTVVAVIDVGVAYDHADLAANMRDGSSCKNDAGANM
jgi:thermitase